jgi:hypothetical protein
MIRHQIAFAGDPVMCKFKWKDGEISDNLPLLVDSRISVNFAMVWDITKPIINPLEPLDADDPDACSEQKKLLLGMTDVGLLWRDFHAKYSYSHNTRHKTRLLLLHEGSNVAGVYLLSPATNESSPCPPTKLSITKGQWFLLLSSK